MHWSKTNKAQEVRDRIGLANKKKIAWNKGLKNESIHNEKHFNWKGEEVSREGLHQWVNRYKGKPIKCELCGTEEAKKYEWANRDHSYKRILDDYIRMCTSCHRNYDMNNNNYPKFKGRPRKIV